MKGCRILVVEDSRTQAEALRALLEKEGAIVDVAGSGEEAMTRLADDIAPLPDLVLTDIVMPGLSGYDLTRRIKSDTALDQVPVVLLTSLTDPLDIVRGLECGADNYVTKPYEPEYLVARLKHVLGQKRFHRGLRASFGVNVQFLGTTFTITSEREQILDLFLSSVEDVVRTNAALEQSQQELAEAQRQLEHYARQMAERAHTSSEQLRAVIEASPMAIIAIDGHERVTLWNPAAEQMLGYLATEVLDASLPTVTPDSREQFDDDLRRIAAGATVRRELAVTTKEGATVEVIMNAAPLRDATGAVNGAMAILEDVTEHKRTAAALAESQAQLIQAQKMEAIGTLASGIAHDFNNLLTVMRSYSGMLVEELPKGLEEPRQFAGEILAAADRASGLTRQLLSFSRKQALAPRPASVDDVIGGVREMLRRLVPATIDMVFVPGAGGALVRIDPGQLEQAVMNLVINASHAMPRGGRIEVRTRVESVDHPRTVRAGELTSGRHVVLSVCDTGTGMNDATLAKLFDPFFTTKPAGTGTGLGLTIVRNIVIDHEGAIDVRSASGQGTTFEVFLPVLSSPAAEPQLIPRHVPTGKEVVLVVDGDETVRNTVRVALERFGYTVLDAQDATQALQFAGMLSTPPDLLLMDVTMPDEAGRELMTQLRRGDRKPRVLLMSGVDGADSLSRTGSWTRYPSVQKPFTREVLARMVREVLDGPRAD